MNGDDKITPQHGVILKVQTENQKKYVCKFTHVSIYKDKKEMEAIQDLQEMYTTHLGSIALQKNLFSIVG